MVPALTQDPAVLLGPFAALNFVGFIFVWVFVREVSKERPVRAQSAEADNQEKRMEPMTLEGLFKVFEPKVSVHIHFCWERLIGWRRTGPTSIITYNEERRRNDGANIEKGANVPIEMARIPADAT